MNLQIQYFISLEMQPIEGKISSYRNRWLVHLSRMPACWIKIALPKQVLQWTTTETTFKPYLVETETGQQEPNFVTGLWYSFSREENNHFSDQCELELVLRNPKLRGGEYDKRNTNFHNEWWISCELVDDAKWNLRSVGFTRARLQAAVKVCWRHRRSAWRNSRRN